MEGGGGKGCLGGGGGTLATITLALCLSRVWSPKAEKETQHQLDLSEITWGYSPRGIGLSGLISPLPDRMDSLNRGSCSASLGPETRELSLGASETPGEGLGICITL